MGKIRLSSKSSDLNYPSVKPTLDLNFAASRTLDPRITFTRASTGTYVGADGLIKTAVNNEPRFDHDPLTGFCNGLLIEESRTNLALNSQKLSLWSNNGSGISITPNSEIAPDGTLTADRLSQSTVKNANRSLYNTGTFIRSGQIFTTSFWLKKVSGNDVESAIGISGIGGGPVTTFTATTEWKRYVWTWTALNDNNTYEVAGIFFLGWDLNGAPNNNVYSIWGFQVEQGTFATSYIPTVGTTVTRAADTASITGRNFSSWYNLSRGTFFVEVRIVNTTQGGIIGIINSGGNDIPEGMILLGSTVQLRGVNYLDSDGSNNDIIFNNPSSGLNKWCVSGDIIDSTTGAIFNGSFGTVNASRTQAYLNVAGIKIGDRASQKLSGTISRLTYYPKRLPAAQLQQLTK